MVSDTDAGWVFPTDGDAPPECDGDLGTGPVFWEDDAWYTQHVASRGYPPVHRTEPVFAGQTSLLCDLCGQFLHTRSCCSYVSRGDEA